jgi:choline/glycine/proline betaine transport protein
MKINPYVFFSSAAFILLFVIAGAVFNESIGVAFADMQDFVVTKFGWFYTLSVGVFLIFVLWLMLSRYGKVRLGKDDEKPAYSYFTWFAMLFSAGMGIGLLFYGVAEPISHFGKPPRAEPMTVEAARDAINITFFHWGLHAWAIYIVIGLALAYFAYRHDLPLSIRSTLYPVLGKRIYGPAGHAVDTLAVICTLFGLASSLGLGVMQINAGLDYLGLVSVSTQNQIILIAVITLAATVSVVTGVDAGIRRLSELNLILALLLMAFVFFAGPTLFLLSSFVQSVGRYAGSIVELTFRTDAFIGLDWQKSWTMFYWAWWISWSPFVGMFIARVSRGRTIREFIAGVLFVPTILTFAWMVIFGNTAISMDLFGDGGMVAAVDESIPTAIFVMLNRLPLSSISAVVATFVVAVFFVTSSDSGSLVVDILTSGGHPNPPVAQRVFWALTEGAVAAVLLVTGGLLAMQTAAVTTALPFCVIMLVICWGLVKQLRKEHGQSHSLGDLKTLLRKLPEVGATLIHDSGTPDEQSLRVKPTPLLASTADLDWRRRLERRLHGHTDEERDVTAKENAENVLTHTVMPAFEQLKRALETHGRDVELERSEDRARLVLPLPDALTYEVQVLARDGRVFTFPRYGATDGDMNEEGKKAEYDPEKVTQREIIHGFLETFEAWGRN